jgi:hypothetical protein
MRRPTARRLSPKYACIYNLKHIDGAVQQWALVNGHFATTTYTLRDPLLLGYLKGSVVPICPLHGTYSSGTNVNESPRCSVPGHSL